MHIIWSYRWWNSMKVTKAADAHVNISDVPTTYCNICDTLDTDVLNTKFWSATVRLISLTLLYSRTKLYKFSFICAKDTNTKPETEYDACYTTCENLISFLEVVLRRLKNQLNSTCITFIVFDMNLHVVKCLQQPLNSVKFILLLVSLKYGAKNKGASIT